MRSTDSDSYQHVPRAVGVMSKQFASGVSTGRHSHRRGQVLYATAGLMLARTASGTWAVPTGHALLIPPNLQHDITMHGAVRMLTAYIAPTSWARVSPDACTVVRVSRLLDAALEALSEEAVVYGERGRRIAAVVLDEVARAQTAALALPLPQTGRLAQVCARFIAEPGAAGDLERWAEAAGVSRRTLTRRFRAETGLSFGQWRRRLRELQAMKLAAEGLATKEIARRVGYGSPQALAAMLRREGRPEPVVTVPPPRVARASAARSRGR